MKKLPIIAVVIRPTRLQGLKQRWVTAKQAEFRMQYAAAHEVQLRRQRASGTADGRKSFDAVKAAAVVDELYDPHDFFDEDQIYQQAVQRLLKEIDLGFPLKTVQRNLIANFDFDRCVAVVVIGPDGLVANTAKYAGGLPILGINPDPSRNDGVLLPFGIESARSALQTVLDDKARTRAVSLAEVNTNDGQRMLAFNDFFVGASSHVSARYTIEVQNRVEPQSSSGILVSTGVGSTGWMSSLFNMAKGIGQTFGSEKIEPVQLSWDDRRLVWMIREPFVSRHSQADMVAGFLEEDQELVVGSQMDTNGVIFSDGIESDFIEFNAGTVARFKLSRQTAALVEPFFEAEAGVAKNRHSRQAGNPVVSAGLPPSRE